MNPCRCGRASDPGFACRRGPNTRCAAEYQTKLSGPLLDRIDLNIEVPAVTAADLILPPPTEGSKEVALRVARARAIQADRYAALGLPGVTTNAAAPASLMEEVAKPDATGLALLRDAADKMRLSARGYHRVLRVARTLADLDSRPRASRRSAVLPRADRRDQKGGVEPSWNPGRSLPFASSSGFNRESRLRSSERAVARISRM